MRKTIFALLFLVLPALGLPARAETREVLFETAAHLYAAETENRIVLSGVRESAVFVSGIRISVYDGETLVAEIRPRTDSGYEPQLLLADFTGKGFPQLFYSASSGGSGGFSYYYVFDVEGSGARTLFDYEAFSRENRYSGRFLEGFRAEVRGEGLRYLLDVSEMDSFFRDKIFDSEGNVLSEEEIFVSDVNTVFPYWNAGMKRNQLLVLQRATAVASVNQLGYVATWLTWGENGFTAYYHDFSLLPAA